MDSGYRLADRYEKTSGRIHVTGDQALVRLLLERRRLDQRQDLTTSGYVSGYRGSPLGGLDIELGRAASFLQAENICFEPGVNEDLAATAIWGTQQSSLMPGRTREGVFALWYGKGPGVDRSGDALKHGNLAGVSRHGGVLAVAGDDPGAKSSSLAHQSEPAFVAAGMPVIYPATLQDAVVLGVHAWEMSRASSCWVGFKVVTELMDSSASIDLEPAALEPTMPPEQLAPADYIAWSKPALVMEESLTQRRLPMAQAYWRANQLDRVHHPAGRRIGIVASGRAYLEVREALCRIGVDENTLDRLGLRIYQVSLVWPLEPAGAAEFALGLQDLLVVEEKQPLIEEQLARYLYGYAERPRLAGKKDTGGRALIPAAGELTADLLVPLLVRWLQSVTPQWTPAPAAVPPLATRELTLLTSPRTAAFCAGCPHNLSTTVPDGSVALGGIGCHGMAVGMAERNTLAYSQMGGEGATWIGMSHFVADEHIFQNLGDGTFYHSGLMAVRAAVAAGVNITYKVLANGAIAMTGGQPIEGEPTDGAELVPGIVRQLRALGVKEIVVLNDGTHRYPKRALPGDVDVLLRDRLGEVQDKMRTVPGVSAIVFDQFCAAEARRLRKRGRMPTPDRRMVINERVCEGCGDCNHVSNCIAIEPAETPLGRKRRINQAACNLDLSCVKGYCPSFVTVTGGVLPSAPATGLAELDRHLADLAEPVTPVSEADVLIAGIGGTGISTTGAILGMAAHLEGRDVSVLNQTGLAQKNGPVSSHVRISGARSGIFGRRIGPAADVLLAADLLTAADPKLVRLLAADRTCSIVDTAVAPTASLALMPDLDLTAQPLVAAVASRSRETVARSFKGVATALLGAGTEANIVLLGYALQRGLLGVGRPALERAIELNGVAVQANQRALGLGRLLAAEPEIADRLVNPAPRAAAEPAAEAIVADRAAELVKYQDESYAQRYRALVQLVLDRERVITGTGDLSRAVATYFFKLMAFKDEYEVARLYTDGVFAGQLNREFGRHQAIALNLAPQRFVPKDPRTGRPRKVEIPGRIGLPALRVLASLKRLRGGPLDVFGHTQHRRRERALIAEYEQLITGLLPDLTDGTYPIAVELARVPEQIRGYGDIKDASITQAQLATAELLTKFRELEEGARMETYDVDPYPVGWYFVAFSDELGPQSVTHVHYFGQELVLYRGESGTVHASDAYCPHQGAHLGWGGKVKAEDLVCPFHGWQWGPDGSNTVVPYAACDRGARLPVWAARELDGMIFVWYHPDHAAPTWEPQPVPEFSQSDYPPTWRSEPIELTVNLQDTFENGVDAAHFVSVHRAFEMPKVEIVLNDGPHFIADMPDQKLRSDRGPFEASVSSDYWGLGIDIARMRSGFLSIVYVMLQTPVDEGLIRVRFHISVKRLSSKDPAAESPEWVARIGSGIVTEFMNDKAIWDHKIYRNQPRLADNESPVREFRLWARQFYASQSATAQAGA